MNIKNELSRIGNGLDSTVQNVFDTKLMKISRDDLTTSGITLNNLNPTMGNFGGATKFPSDLEPEKTMAIHVYDTSKNDEVFQGLLDTTQNVMAAGTSMFGEFGNAAASALTGSTQNIFTQGVQKVAGGLLGTNSTGIINDLSSGFKNFIGELPSINLGVSNAKLAKTYHETFYLPIPNGLQEAISNTYEEQPGWVNDMPLMGEGSMARGGLDAISKASATWSKISGARNVQYYENQIQMYTSTDFREITLTWDLVPNNAAESRTLHEIARKIKMYGSPEAAAGKLMIKSPCFFGIEFNNDVLDRALQFCEVVLVNISIDYVPGGNMEMNEDKTPKSVSFTMSFRDRQPKLREDWEGSMGCGNGLGSNDQSCPIGT